MRSRGHTGARPKRRPRRTAHEKTLGRRLRATWPLILWCLFVAPLYANTALFRKLETGVLDVYTNAREPQHESDILIVRITPQDYLDSFGGRSPLDPSKLKEVLGVIASAGPRIIGVAIDTSASEFQTLDVQPGWPPVVWARGSVYSDVHQKHLLSGALGRPSPSVPSGLVELKLDPDGVLRRYSRWYDTDAGPAPSLPWALLMKLRNEEVRAGETHDLDEEFLIDYPGPRSSKPFMETTVSALLTPSGSGRADNNIFKDKIVLLGGDYAAQDEHDTPVGPMLGAEILASIIETERRGEMRKPIGTPAIILLAVIEGVALLLLIDLFGRRKLLLVLLLFTAALALVGGLLLLRSLHYVGHFLLVLIAVLLYQVYEKGKEYPKQLRERAADELK